MTHISRGRSHAKDILAHYICRLMLEQGLNWDMDNRIEVEEIVDCIMDPLLFEIDDLKRKIDILIDRMEQREGDHR